MEGLPSASASTDRDRLPIVREMGRHSWQCLAVNRILTRWGSWWILQPIRISLVEPSQEIGRPAFIASYGGSLNSRHSANGALLPDQRRRKPFYSKEKSHVTMDESCGQSW
jgi:hypothetical protein